MGRFRLCRSNSPERGDRWKAVGYTVRLRRGYRRRSGGGPPSALLRGRLSASLPDPVGTGRGVPADRRGVLVLIGCVGDIRLPAGRDTGPSTFEMKAGPVDHKPVRDLLGRPAPGGFPGGPFGSGAAVSARFRDARVTSAPSVGREGGSPRLVTRVRRRSGPPRSAPVACASTRVSPVAFPRARGAGTPRPGIAAPGPWRRVTAVTSAKTEGGYPTERRARSNAFDDGTRPVPVRVGNPRSPAPRANGVGQSRGSARGPEAAGTVVSLGLNLRSLAAVPKPTGDTGGGTLRPAGGFPSCHHEREAPSRIGGDGRTSLLVGGGRSGGLSPPGVGRPPALLPELAGLS